MELLNCEETPVLPRRVFCCCIHRLCVRETQWVENHFLRQHRLWHTHTQTDTQSPTERLPVHYHSSRLVGALEVVYAYSNAISVCVYVWGVCVCRNSRDRDCKDLSFKITVLGKTVCVYHLNLPSWKFFRCSYLFGVLELTYIRSDILLVKGQLNKK